METSQVTIRELVELTGKEEDLVRSALKLMDVESEGLKSQGKGAKLKTYDRALSLLAVGLVCEAREQVNKARVAATQAEA